MEFKNNKFKILQLTDTHFGILPAVEEDLKTYKAIERIIKAEKPDLIVHTGDIIWSEGIENPEEIFVEVMEFFDKLDIPIAITFGNHDSEDNVSRRRLREIFDQKISNKAPKSNSFIVDDFEAYTMEIKDGEDLILPLYLIDSGDYDKNSYGLYDYVKPEQVEWFRNAAESLKKGDGIKKGIVFQHIPVPEYWFVIDDLINGKCLETDEIISAPKINTGLFANMVLNGEIWGMSVGHDHDNNFLAKYHDLYLSFANSTGYNAYGEVNKGVSVFEITKDPFEIIKRNVSFEGI